MSAPIHHTTEIVCPLCEEKLKDAHPTIADWFRRCVKPAHPDAHISWSYRDEANQNACVQSQKSKLKWPNSPHNKRDPITLEPKSEALDLWQMDQRGQMVERNGAWFAKIADETAISGEHIFWGGHFKTIHDGDHFQMQVV